MLIVSDLLKLNFGQNGDKNKSKFVQFFTAMNTIFEVGDTGAHEKRRTQVNDVRMTIDIAFTTQFNSLVEVVSQTVKYLKSKLPLEERKYFHVSSSETV